MGTIYSLQGGKLEELVFVRVGTVRVGSDDGSDAVIVKRGFLVFVGSHCFISPAFACKLAERAEAIASLLKVLAVKVFAVKVSARLVLVLELKNWSETRTKTLGGIDETP